MNAHVGSEEGKKEERGEARTSRSTPALLKEKKRVKEGGKEATRIQGLRYQCEGSPCLAARR
jgi:hypothetical protein